MSQSAGIQNAADLFRTGRSRGLDQNAVNLLDDISSFTSSKALKTRQGRTTFNNAISKARLKFEKEDRYFQRATGYTGANRLDTNEKYLQQVMPRLTELKGRDQNLDIPIKCYQTDCATQFLQWDAGTLDGTMRDSIVAPYVDETQQITLHDNAGKPLVTHCPSHVGIILYDHLIHRIM